MPERGQPRRRLRRQPQPAETLRLDEVSDWDGAMRDAMHHESVEVLRHQLDVERGQSASMERQDYFFSLAVVGFAFGLGYGTGGIRPQIPTWFKSRG